jgi:hypothetical protein
MKYFVRHFFTGLMILALTSAVAFAKVRKDSITLATDTTVAGTLLKAGTYDVKFDDKTSELSFTREGSSKAAVKTTVQLKDRTDKARNTQFSVLDNTLVSVAFGGQKQDVVIGQSSTQAEQ